MKRMLIPFNEVCSILKNMGIHISGILHIGAHECEERSAYNKEGILDENIYWIEGNSDKVALNKKRGVPNIYEALIFNEEKEVDFHLTKNTHNPGNAESSSILPLGLHEQYYPYVQVQEIKKMKTTTLNHLIRNEHIPVQNLNFWNLDIQGVELEAIKSAEEMIQFADIIYLEVNIQPLYQKCALLPEIEVFLKRHGFKLVKIQLTQQGWGDALFVRT